MTTNYDTIIIGAGLSGLATANKLKLQNPDHKILLLEKGSRAGGAIWSHKDEGYIAEIGPHGFLDNCQESRELLEEVGLAEKTVKAPLLDFVRYVYLHKKLNLIPQTPKKIIKAPLIPWKDKFRVLGDLMKKPLEGEPTVAKWVNHRFGSALLPYLDAVFTGTYAGDYNQLKIDAVMPGIRQIEKDHGSVIKGLATKMWRNRKEGNRKKLSMPSMTSFSNGMEGLTDHLAAPFFEENNLLLETEVTEISQEQDHWQTTTSNGTNYLGRNLVIAIPVTASLKLLRKIDDTMPCQCIPESKMATVVFAYDNGATLPPGFGFLIPEVEQRFTLGTLFSSNMFPGRAPEGHIVFETLVGGRRHPERLEMSNFDLTKHALTDIKEILNLPGEPCYTRVLRPTSGIPQLEAGYTDLLAWRDNLQSNKTGLHICGFGWEGIGINDMIKVAVRIAQNIKSGEQEAQQVEVKKVYF